MQSRVAPQAMVPIGVAEAINLQFNHLGLGGQADIDGDDPRLRALIDQFAVGQHFVFHMKALHVVADRGEAVHPFRNGVLGR